MRMLIILVLYFISSVANATRINSCEDFFSNEIINISLASQPTVKTQKGTIKFTIDWHGKERALELPSSIMMLRKLKDLHVIVLAGNTFYEGTYHNLAFHFGDYLVEKANFKGHSDSSSFRPSTETFKVTYDDATQREGTSTFYSEKDHFRTENGEIFYRQLENGKTVVLIRPIGDYNEIGDFATAVIQALGVPVEKVLLINDNLKLEPKILEIQKGPLNPGGNNSVFSMNRTLAYQLLESFIESTRSNTTFGPTIAESQYAELRSTFISKANQREGSSSFKNIAPISRPIKSFVSKVVRLKSLKNLITEARQPLQEYNKQKGMINRELFTNKNLTDSEVKNLEASLSNLELTYSNEIQQFNNRSKELEEEFKVYNGTTVNLIQSALSYSRLSIGTGAPDSSKLSLSDFVTSKYPKDDFTDSLWESAWQKIKLHINNEPASE